MQVRVLVKGTVQGVGFRPFVYRLATKLGLSGYVKNVGRGVEIVLQGERNKINSFLKLLRKNPPPLANLEEILVNDYKGKKFDSFFIAKSSVGTKKEILIPPDVGTCNECLKEIDDRKNRRYRYWFITCTNCGPRFTIIKKLPYDREVTTMKEFQLCESCEEEFKNPLDRRYHAQTVACKKCGPQLKILDRVGREIVCKDPIEKAVKFLKAGKVVAIKGVGGFHLACLTTKDEAVRRLREKRKKFSQKPFAIMAKDVEMIKTFAEVNKVEERLLKSWQKPIVLLKKSRKYWLSPLVSPGLHNIGVMLPYTGLHYLILKEMKEPLVMTSGNLPNEPTITEEEEALNDLHSIADVFLIHDREIYQRCDDSVIKVINGTPVFLRRSRGYVPSPIPIDCGNKKMLALGAELQNTFCIYIDKKAFLSQHVGDVETYKTLSALKLDVKKFSNLLGVKNFDRVLCDMHPNFLTTRLAKEMTQNGSELIKVQHHFAHLASCMAENGLEKAIGIVCDGYGFGLDGNAWGGEVILSNGKGFRRIGHLEYQPLIGGDIATIYPNRIVVSILSKFVDKEKIFKILKGVESREKVKVWLRQLESGFNIVQTSSCGRFLDAVSALLGVCRKRTYEGEPAMKLEALALKGRKILELPIEIEKKNGELILNTTAIFKEVYELLNKTSKENIALSVHYALAKGLAEIVKLKNKSIPVCFTGGVAYNEIFHRALSEEFDKLYIQTKVPCGDGGISLGQIYFSKFLDTARL